MQVRHLRGVEADDELHFRRAAERLHDGPSAVSQQLHKLETELGGLAEDRRRYGGWRRWLRAARRRRRCSKR
jgi:hypothetical protein